MRKPTPILNSNLKPRRKTRGFFAGNSGFSLIELIIVIFVGIILFGLGMASYRRFNRRQELERAVRQVKSDLRLAQELAIAGKKPSSCDTLQGYGIYFQGDTYRLEGFCEMSGNNWRDCHQVQRPQLCIKYQVELPENVSISMSPTNADPPPKSNTILFNVLAQGTNAADTSGGMIMLTLTSSLTGDTKDIYVYANGKID